MDVAETYANPEEPLAPDLSHLVTEDETPVDNRYSERQYSLLKGASASLTTPFTTLSGISDRESFVFFSLLAGSMLS